MGKTDQQNQSCLKRIKKFDEESLKEFHGLLNFIPDAIIIICKRGTICSLNTMAARLFGYQKDEMVGNNLAILIAERFHEKYRKLISGFFASPYSRTMTTSLDLFGRKKNGQEIPLEISISPLQVEKDIMAMSLIRDISDRKKTEEAVKRLNQELEQRVIRRTMQLKEANEDLRTFSYSVSHDLRAPLTGINGFSQVLLEDYGAKLDNQGKEYLRRIHDSSLRMEELIDDLLTLSRVTQSKISVDRVDLSALSDSIIAELRKRSPKRDLEWCNTDGVVVEGDVRLLRLVMENLLDNAWKYTGKKPRAKIEFGVTDHKGESVCYVRDNGAGFDMAYIDKLFSPFQRLHGQDEFPGNGIGLATVQRIINRHGGAVWGEGAVDQGAIFYFRI